MCKFTVTLDGCSNCSNCQDESSNFNDFVIPRKLGIVFKTKDDGSQDDSKLEEGDIYHGYVEDKFVEGIYLGGNRSLLSSYNLLSSLITNS